MERTSNFQVTAEDGSRHWVSRSVAVVAVIFVEDKNNQVFTPLARRSNKMKRYAGHLGLPCGFIDFGETAAEAVIREVKEEIGLTVKPSIVPSQPTMIMDDPAADVNQVISFRYLLTWACNDELPELIASDEALAPRWVNVQVLPDEELAFNHRELILWGVDKYYDYA